MNTNLESLPVAVVGGGPIGLAAAAQLLERGFSPMILEAGPTIAAHLDSYRHVKLFSPWRFNVDRAARSMLEAQGWSMPDLDALPTAGEMIDSYLAPLALLPEIAKGLRMSHRVVGITREGFDKAKTAGREEAAFVVRVETPRGFEELRASAVIDASGTWGTPNPLGANGLPAIGETDASEHIAYGMPDVLGTQRARYAGKRVLVAGAGHSAAGTLLALAKLAEQSAGTQIVWTIRGHNFARIFGGGENDGLAARGALGERLHALTDAGRLEVQADFRAMAIRSVDGRMAIEGVGAQGEPRSIANIDELVVAAGARPNLSLASELRVKLDSWLESTEALAPLIDPNVHSCGTVRPHGHRELQHPEARFYIAGAKSYGRAPNFLLATGHEQVRSIVAALAGDLAAADDVQLELPETGVCSTQFDEASSGCCTGGEAAAIPVIGKVAAQTVPSAAPRPASSCCGGPPKVLATACCVEDEVVKAAGKGGCGSSGAKAAPKGTSRCGG